MRRGGGGGGSSPEASGAEDAAGGPGEGGGDPGGASPGRAPLKTVLQNFLNHVDTLEARKSEGEDTYDREFQQLKAFSDSLRSRQDFSCGQGELEVNRKKNRYKDILPYDGSRVALSEYPGVPGSDYINANYIKGASGSNAYIAAQGPLPHTVNDFWRMVVEAEVQVIVMACNETEAGKHKCERYWSQPEDAAAAAAEDGGSGGDEERQFGKFFVKTLKMREICPDFLVRTMRLRWTPDGADKEEERTVCQFHYSAWPDHGIPVQVKPLLEMVRLIRDCQASETLPVLVHCSAGCGRTGTICAIDFIWGLLRTGKLTADFSLYELVKDMRRQRIAMVQTVEQYILVHRAVRELFLEQMRVIDSHPYENVDDDGNPLCRNPDEITPDYETIFVKDADQVQNDIDRILTQRISQLPKTVMGTAMLAKANGSGSSSSNISNAGSKSEECLSSTAPAPPPKQRGALDSAAIENRRIMDLKGGSFDFTPVDEFTRRSDPVLFEPAKPRDGRDKAVQRFKKGSLRLKQADNGAWKLEELEDKADKKDGKKKKKSKEDGGESLLLRRPSIKKIRAFFGKDKEGKNTSPSSGPPYPVGAKVEDTSGEDSPQSDPEFASALSKLPKFEPETPEPQLGEGGLSGSKSVPNSLDRRGRKGDPDYANVGEFNRSGGGGEPLSRSGSRRSRAGSSSKESSPSVSSPKHSLRAAVSTERLESPALDAGEHNNNGKPNLPVKRSKSMKSATKPVSVIPLVDDSRYHNVMIESKSRGSSKPKAKHLSPDGSPPFQSLPTGGNSAPAPYDNAVRGRDGGRHSRQGSLEASLPPPSKPKRQPQSQQQQQLQAIGVSPEHTNIKLDQATAFATRRSSEASSSIPDYANVSVKRDSLPDERSREKFLEQHLAKLHARISSVTHPEEDPSIPAELKKTLPLIARSSDSLDDDAKRMLKDCQEYLMASFSMAEKEGDKLLFRNPLKNRSAESSPMTTLQKSSASQHLYSSHSSPSNSYNKYYGSGKVSSPPGTIQKSIKSPTGAIQKNFCSPANIPPQSLNGDSSAAPLRTKPSPTTPKTSPSTDNHRPVSNSGSYLQTRQEEKGDADKAHHDYANVSMSKGGVLGGDNTVLEAQRKVSAASSTKGSRERRNSFREAVEKGNDEEGGQGEKNDDFDGRMAYESIWFEKERRREEDQSVELRGGKQRQSAGQRRHHHHHHHHHHHRRSTNSQKAEPQAEYSPQQQQQRSRHQSHYRDQDRESSERERRRLLRSRHAVSGSYDNVAAGDSGYEPVNFKDSGSSTSSPRGGEGDHGGGSSRHRHHHQLQSVGLVAEVMGKSNSQQQPYHHQHHHQQQPPPSLHLSMQSEASSYNPLPGRSNPPPYKEPPQPSRGGGLPENTFGPPRSSDPRRQEDASFQQNGPRGGYHRSDHHQFPSYSNHGNQNSPRKQYQARPDPKGSSSPPRSSNENSNTYVNVQVSKRQTQETARGTRDDLALGGGRDGVRLRRRGGGPGGRRGNNPANRYSLGDFPMFNTRTPPQSYTPNQHGRQSHIEVSKGLVVKPANPQQVRQHQLHHQTSCHSQMSSGGGGESLAPVMYPSSGSSPRNSERPATVASPPGVDLDTVAAMMQNRDLANSNYGGSKPQLGRTLAGVISGAAANLRSRLHHLSSAPDLGAGGSLVQAAAAAGDRSPSVSQGRRASEHDALAAVGIGEQSATNIPITVPGAAAYVDASRPEPFAYPQRLDSRPRGPREAPSFRRKQEYL